MATAPHYLAVTPRSGGSTITYSGGATTPFDTIDATGNVLFVEDGES